MKQMGRKLMGLAMSLVLLAVLLPGTAKAAEQESPAGLDLTQAEDVTYSYGENGTANWVKSTLTLTLSGDGKIEAEGDNKGITLPAGSQLVVAENAHWTVKGADSESAGYHGIYADGDLELEIKQNASLDLAGGHAEIVHAKAGLRVRHTVVQRFPLVRNAFPANGLTNGIPKAIMNSYHAVFILSDMATRLGLQACFQTAGGMEICRVVCIVTAIHGHVQSLFIIFSPF